MIVAQNFPKLSQAVGTCRHFMLYIVEVS
uniref:Uncharacterized protein n=1 Tax=Arundo donax TaxID=35708 RepID=A0A0A8YWJ7_ARUDO